MLHPPTHSHLSVGAAHPLPLAPYTCPMTPNSHPFQGFIGVIMGIAAAFLLIAGTHPHTCMPTCSLAQFSADHWKRRRPLDRRAQHNRRCILPQGQSSHPGHAGKPRQRPRCCCSPRGGCCSPRGTQQGLRQRGGVVSRARRRSRARKRVPRRVCLLGNCELTDTTLCRSHAMNMPRVLGLSRV